MTPKQRLRAAVTERCKVISGNELGVKPDAVERSADHHRSVTAVWINGSVEDAA